MAIQNHLAFQLIPILLDVVVLHHNDHHVHLGEELVKIENLIRHNLLVGEKGVETLEWTSKVSSLDVEHLESGAFAHIIHIFLVGDAVETHTTVVGNIVCLHNLIDSLQHEHRLGVVGLHTLVNHLC